MLRKNNTIFNEHPVSKYSKKILLYTYIKYIKIKLFTQNIILSENLIQNNGHKNRTISYLKVTTGCSKISLSHLRVTTGCSKIGYLKVITGLFINKPSKGNKYVFKN